MSKPKKIIQPGESRHIPMTMMDSANPVDTLHKRLTDAQAAYHADLSGDTLNAVHAAQRALNDAKGDMVTPVADNALSLDYMAGARDGMIFDIENAWRE